MLDNITSVDEILKQAKEMNDYLCETTSEDPNECIEHGNVVSSYLSYSGKLLADAKYHQDRARKESILTRLNIDLSPSMLKELVNSDCEKENYAVNLMDRINRDCTHKIDWLRTLISKAKAEMNLQR